MEFQLNCTIFKVIRRPVAATSWQTELLDTPLVHRRKKGKCCKGECLPRIMDTGLLCGHIDKTSLMNRNDGYDTSRQADRRAVVVNYLAIKDISTLVSRRLIKTCIRRSACPLMTRRKTTSKLVIINRVNLSVCG